MRSCCRHVRRRARRLPFGAVQSAAAADRRV
ncbi:hypothetical protein B566_EDAN007288, partial [Ephemera danica]